MKLFKPTIVTISLIASACASSGSDDSVATTATTSVSVTSSTTSTTVLVEATESEPSGPSPSAADIIIPTELQATPSQAEGPYYPVSKPQDRDNNLLVVSGESEVPLGTPLEVSGLLVTDDGVPVVGAIIEIWQVDGQGIYDHPAAPDTENRDLRFQFYGESVTDDDGFWTFLTLDPLLYNSRPRHIHTKIKIDGDEALTTQIYFDGDPLLAADGVAARAGDELVLLTSNATPGMLSNGLEGLVALHVIVLPR